MSSNPFGLRVAGVDDLDALVAFALPVLRDDAVQPISTAKVEALVLRCLTRENAIAGVLEGEHGIEASVGATIDTFDYTDQPHCMVRWLGVGSRWRKSDRPARMVGFVHWLWETLSEVAEQPMPVFLPAATAREQMGKVKLYARRAPLVGVVHAWGCDPDRSFFHLGHKIIADHGPAGAAA